MRHLWVLLVIWSWTAYLSSCNSDITFPGRTVKPTVSSGTAESEACRCCPVFRGHAKGSSTPTFTCRCCSDSPVRRPACKMFQQKLDRVDLSKNISLGDWPWVGAIGYHHMNSKGEFIGKYMAGAATLISDIWAITAAYCAKGTQYYKVKYLRFGDLNVDENDEEGEEYLDADVAEVIQHPLLQSSKNHNDIALIRLKKPVQFTSSIYPICLWNGPTYREQDFYKGKSGYVASWGVPDLDDVPFRTNLRVKEAVVTVYGKCSWVHENKIAKPICVKMDKNVFEIGCAAPLFFPNSEENRYYLGAFLSNTKNNLTMGVFNRIADYTEWIKNVTAEKFW